MTAQENPYLYLGRNSSIYKFSEVLSGCIILFELDVALAKRKILYEKQYPETKHGAYMKKERKKGQKTLPKKPITARSSSIDLKTIDLKKKIN